MIDVSAAGPLNPNSMLYKTYSISKVKKLLRAAQSRSELLGAAEQWERPLTAPSYSEQGGDNFILLGLTLPARVNRGLLEARSSIFILNRFTLSISIYSIYAYIRV